MVPDRLVGGDHPSGERRLFDAFAAALPAGYVVLHSVRWLSRPRAGARPKEFEVDFVVLHPDHGALVIEVKGGLVGFDAATGTWASKGRDGAVYGIKDPEWQARSACHALMDLVQSAPGGRVGFGPFGYGVAFPDGVLVSSPTALPPEIVITATEVNNSLLLRGAVERLFKYWSSATGGSSTQDGVNHVVRLLARDLTMREPLVMAVNEADRAIIRLSEQQFAILDYMRSNRRVAVAGCAGSGKTLLAVAKAKELAAQGFRVLLTCFNRGLASYLETVVEEVTGLEVRSFHQLCRRLAMEAEVALDWPAEPTTEFFERDLPEALVRAVDRLGSRYDAIVADEAQDFASSWWDALLLLLTDPDSGVLFVFYDDNQALYDRPKGLPQDMVEFCLAQNWRNTRQINDRMLQYYRGPTVRCMGPAGPEVEILQVESGISVLRSALGRLLHRLHVEGGIPTREMVVLTPRSVADSGLRGSIGSFRLVEELEQAQDIRLSSIHGFKGLDAKVVVLAGVRPADTDVRELMYVGCSRARSHLVVLEQR